MDQVNDVSAVISEKDRKEVSAFSLRITLKRILIVGLIGLVFPYLALLIFFVGLPIRGLFTPKRAKSVFIISLIWILAVVTLAFCITAYILSMSQDSESRNIGDDVKYCSLYEQSEKSLDCAPDAETMEFFDSHVDKLYGWYSEFKNNPDGMGNYERSQMIYEYTEYVKSLPKTSWTVNEFDYEGKYVCYDGTFAEENGNGGSADVSNLGTYCLMYVTTSDETVTYNIDPPSPDNTGFIDIEKIVNEDYGTWSALYDSLNERITKATNDLEKASSHFSGEVPYATGEEAFNAWSDYVKHSFILIRDFAPFILIFGFAFFLTVVILSIVLNTRYANGGKDLRDYAYSVRDKICVINGKKESDAFVGELQKLSKKRDAEGFFRCAGERDAYCDSVLSSLPYKTVGDAKTMMNEIVSRAVVLDGASAGKAVRAQLNKLWNDRDHARLIALNNEYAARFEEYKKQFAKETAEGGETYESEYEGKSVFDGRLIRKIGWDILCFIVKWITLTIAKPATECWKQRWYCKHTVIDGRRLSFDGNGLQLFGKRTLILFLTIITLGIYALFSKFAMDKWVAKHTHIAGGDPAACGTFDGNLFVWLLLRLGCFLLRICTLFIISPFTECWKQAWYTKHCVYDGKRLTFDGNGAQLMGKWMLWWLLTIVTIGVYSFFVKLSLKKWVTGHTHFREGYDIVK